MADALPARLYHATIGDLGSLIIEQPHQALISTASIVLISAEAGLVIPWPANIALAVGAEWSFLRGASTARSVETRWATALNWTAATILLIYGGLWTLREFGAITASPVGVWAWVIALLHVVPLFALTLCAAQTHAALLRVQRQTAQRQAVRAEALEEETARKRAAILLEIEQAEQRAMARHRVQAARANTPNKPFVASGTAANSGRDTLRAQVVRTLTENPKANRSQLARELGIGRTTVYELIKEAQAKGEI